MLEWVDSEIQTSMVKIERNIELRWPKEVRVQVRNARFRRVVDDLIASSNQLSQTMRQAKNAMEEFSQAMRQSMQRTQRQLARY